MADVLDFQVIVKPEQIRNVNRMLRAVPKEIPGVFSRGINKTLTKGKSLATKAISKKVNLLQKDVRKQIKIYKATRALWKGTIYFSSRASLIMGYDPIQTPEGVTYEVWKSKGRVLVKSAFFQTVYGKKGRAAGIASGHPGHEMVLKRKSAGGGKLVPRYQVRAVFGPSLADMVKGVVDKVTYDIGKFLEKEIHSQIQYVLYKKRVKRKAG